MDITRSEDGKVKITRENGKYIESQSVEVVLLYEILLNSEEIKKCVSNIETAMPGIT